MTMLWQALPTVRRVAAHDLSSLLQTHAEMAHARQSADNILAVAQHEAASIVESARQNAEQAKSAVLEDVQYTCDVLIDQAWRDAMAIRLTDAADAAGVLTDRFDALSPWLGQFVLDCVMQILGEIEFSTRQQTILAHALSQARQDWNVQLRCHPDNAADLRALVLAESGPHARFRAVSAVVEDDRLPAGECLLESSTGIVDISIQAQIAALQQTIEHALAHGLPMQDETA